MLAEKWPFTWVWRLVFWWKRRTGFVDLGQTVSVVGEVVQIGPDDFDGDINFDIRLDHAHEWAIAAFGGRLTSATSDGQPALHCEIPPWASPQLREFARSELRLGQRVSVRGAWGFDGVHTGRPEWQEILLALWRHQPNLRDGWFEIHPVESLVILADPPRAA